MNKEHKAILIALTLGDGHITNQGTLNIEHSINQKEYVEWKNNILNLICKGKRKSKVNYRERLDKRTNNIYKQVSTSKTHNYFRIIKKWLYKPEKIYSKFILNKLTPQGLAIWFMDDGNLKKRYSSVTDKVSSIQVSLYIHTSIEQAELVRDYFYETWDILFKIYRYKDLYYLCADTKNGIKFINLIKPYVTIDCMKYKVDLEPTSARPLNGGRRYSLNS